MTLVADVAARIGDLELDASVRVGDREVVALLGPNGAGKTTLLRMLAGLTPVEEGRVVLDGAVLEDSGSTVRVPTERRPIGFVFQDYVLFPHMTVLENVAFGLRARGMARPRARAIAQGWLERLDVARKAGERPGGLSGGEAQRVALARALATEPRLLLLDEPLAALDAATRLDVRADLRRHLATFSGARLLVTHDPVEAMVLGDRLVILEHGRVTQEGTPTDVGRHPRSEYVARLVGLNLLKGRGAGHDVLLPTGWRIHLADPVPGGDAFAVIRPQSVALHGDQPKGTPRNVWRLTVAELDAERDRVRVAMEGAVPLVAEVTPQAVAELGLAPGVEVWASVKATDITAYPV